MSRRRDIVIVNLGTGNLSSVRNAIAHVAAPEAVSISADPTEIAQAGHLILPGQGAFGTWFAQLKRAPSLKQAVAARLRAGPVLGICVGMQALCQHSEEDHGVDGFGVFNTQVRRFPPVAAADRGVKRFKIPHIGWNQVEQMQPHPLWHNIDNPTRFYFVHSYYVECQHAAEQYGRCHYRVPFTAASAVDNIFATQFHPEKSQRAGLQLLKNFIQWDGKL